MTSTDCETPTSAKPAPASNAAEALTPAMRQYVEQKERVGDAILLFRMGDFYETFYDDAVLCSKALGIALTSRNKGEKPIPLAGIPYHALDNYLRKLVSAGYKVAISEQLENPQEAKGVVRRDIVRIVTAGTLTEDAILDDKDSNVLAALCVRGGDVGLAWVELAGGRFEVIDVPAELMLDELVRLRPAELLIDDDRGSPAEKLAGQLHDLAGAAITRRPAHEFSVYQAQCSLLDHFQVATLSGFGFDDMGVSLCAAGAAIHYLQETQKGSLPHIVDLERRETGEYLRIDHHSFRALEIERTLRGGSRKGSLFDATDRTVHPGGTRRLKQWLAAPLTDTSAIVARQDAVADLVHDDAGRTALRIRLKSMADLERIVARVALGRASPRDLAGLSRTLDLLPELVDRLKGNRPALSEEIAGDLLGHDDLAQLLRRAVRPDPPMSLREGGFIAEGFDAELDRLRAIGQDGQSWLAEFQRRELQRTGLTSLKVGFNRVFGYYIEVPHSAGQRVPLEYVRRQTVKNAERYITDELKRHEDEVLTAQDRANELESRLFEQLREQVMAHIPALLRAADAIGRLDCIASFAELAVERRYVRPEIAKDGRIEIRDGRHPVLEQTLAERFVPNDTLMTPEDARVLVITGPNMAGKSTHIRQIALLTLLAQAGSFVPARTMRWSIVDRIFARVGSADELARGQSTFMVEMIEAANILRHATPRSLVVLDELGRGTSTFDGLSLAWAITEHLATEIRCWTLVATHYHELTELAGLLTGVKNYNVAVREYTPAPRQSEAVVFLHRIVEGGASKSYGIHVAALAGIPSGVIGRSREILQELERGFTRESHTPQLARKKTRDVEQLPLFREPGEELLEALRACDPNQLTPQQAHQHLSDWKQRFGP